MWFLVWQSREMQRRCQNVQEKEGADEAFRTSSGLIRVKLEVRLLSFPLNDRLYVTNLLYANKR